MDVDPVPAGDGGASQTGSGQDAAAGAIRAADGGARMGLRRHPLVRAVILSDLAVRAVELAAAFNRGCYGDLDRPLVQALADGLGRDLERARRYALRANLQFGDHVSRASVPALIPGQAREHDLALSLARGFGAAVDVACALGGTAGGVLAGRDPDLEMACELAHSAVVWLHRARAIASGLDGSPAREKVLSPGRAISHALGQALERTRVMDRVCAQGLAGRLGLATAEGLAQALTDGALDDFTSADLARASLADADLTGVRWSLAGTAWPPGTDIRAILARSEARPGGVLVLRRRGMMWQPSW